MKKSEKYMLYMSKNTFKQHADSLIIEEKLNMFLSNVLILSCMIIIQIIQNFNEDWCFKWCLVKHIHSA